MIDFSLTEEQLAMQEMAHEFAEKEIAHQFIPPNLTPVKPVARYLASHQAPKSSLL